MNIPDHRIHCLINTVFAAALLSNWPCVAIATDPRESDAASRIVNIVNFIRLLEPRNESITEDVLYQTVVKQIQLMKKHRLPGTFLLQYDALIDKRYQVLLRDLPSHQFEIGGWWELPRPLVEKTGLRWRGRYPWDWHANVGFASGYTPSEREKLVDVYMADFREAFGYYPKSVASWFIDEHSLQYMHDKYGIVASANCKDQIGTDGYTLWGGYWNQAYYPSKLNAFMPAQTEAGQIPVPIFRMLGSDPLRQYDTGIGNMHQGVITLEPVNPESGGNPKWIDWYFQNFVDGECLAFNYVQVGQENSFTWRAMRSGLEYQFPLIARLRDEGKLRVETLAQSGQWFRKTFRTTPATAVTFQSELNGDTRQSVWFNSRFYRANVVWDNGTLRVRDIHLFDQSIQSPTLKSKIDKPDVEFHTLPLVDGHYWSSKDQLAGLCPMIQVRGDKVPLAGYRPTIFRTQSDDLRIAWPLTNNAGELVITLSERTMHMDLRRATTSWWLELTADERTDFPFTEVAKRSLACSFKGTSYKIAITQGSFRQQGHRINIQPAAGGLTLQMVAQAVTSSQVGSAAPVPGSCGDAYSIDKRRCNHRTTRRCECNATAMQAKMCPRFAIRRTHENVSSQKHLHRLGTGCRIFRLCVLLGSRTQ